MHCAPDRIDFPASSAFARAGVAACLGGEREFDLSDLVHFDSSAVAALLEIQRSAGPRPLRFLNPPPNLRKLAAVYGVEALLFGPDGTPIDNDRA